MSGVVIRHLALGPTEPEHMTVGQLNHVVRVLRDELHRARLQSQELQEAMGNLTPTKAVLHEVAAERRRQDAKWGVEQIHSLPNGTGVDYALLRDIARSECDDATRDGDNSYALVLREEVYEALAEDDEEKLAEELVQVAAVCVKWLEKLRARKEDR